MTSSKFIVKDNQQITNESLSEKIMNSVSRLLLNIPSKYTRGLKTIVITESASLKGSQKKVKIKQGGQKTELRKAWGLYHPQQNNESPWIELFIDNILAYWPEKAFRSKFLTDLALAEVVFHEVGHHIYYSYPERTHASTEDEAEKWRRKLNRYYFLRRYWYVMPFLYIFGLLVKTFRKSR